MQRVAPVSSNQFGIFRIFFGAYLLIHFLYLLPYAAELFSREGVLPRADMNALFGIFPNILAVWDSPYAVTGFVGWMAVLSGLFMLGIRRRWVSLFLWYGWACLFNRNNLISNPSLAYVGF